MAAPKAAGTAGGSPQHTPKQFDAAASGYTLNLTPAQLEGLAKLREPFPKSAIAKRPQIKCSGCRNNKQDKVCSSHTKAFCQECGQYVTTAHMHLDYVGHAETTDRLLEVDPTWDWKAMATDDKGQPLIDDQGGMWITLTVCGMTRKGYGDAVGKPATTTATKEIIGDAIRNAAMRFGMALDLWAKTDLHAEPPHPAEPFIDAIRDPRVWSSSEWLAGVREGADEAGQLDFVLPRGGRTLGEVIDAQLAVLEDAAQRYAEMRMKADEEREAREAERAAAAAQVATEHGVRPNTGARPSDHPAPTDGPPITEAEVRNVCTEHWLDPDALERALRAGQKAGVVNVLSRPDDPEGPTLGQAIRRQINDLRRAAARSTGTVRAAQAADQYDQNDDWGSSERAG